MLGTTRNEFTGRYTAGSSAFGTPGCKQTALRRVDGTCYVAIQHMPYRAGFRIDIQYGRQERAGIWVFRIGKHCIRPAVFHHSSHVHDGKAFTKLPNYRQIV